MRARYRSRAPEPITPTKGRSLPLKPKQAQAPLELPPYYPTSLVAKTVARINNALRLFPEASQVQQLCKEIITRLSPDFCAMVRDGELRSDVALFYMGELLRFVLIANCDSAKVFDHQQEIAKSEEYTRLAEATAQVEEQRRKTQVVGRKNLEDDLSSDRCLACLHPKMLHRSGDSIACFADPHKTNTWEENGYPMQDIDVRKEMGIECWCGAFTNDPKRASEEILKHGDHVALKRGIEEAVERGDPVSAKRLKARLLRETTEKERDGRWLDDVERRLSEASKVYAVDSGRASAAADLSTKLENPRQFPTLIVSEAAEALHLSRPTIYRMLENGRLKRASLGAEYGTRRAARVTTESVLAALKPES